MSPAPSQILRILHVPVSMSVENGGPAVVCAGLCAALAERGHAVTIATVDTPGQTPLEHHPAVTVRRFPLKGSPRYVFSGALRQWLAAHVRDFDLVHLHAIWQYPTYAAAQACWSAQVPYCVTLHGMLEHYSVHHRSYLKKRLYWLLRERHIQARAAALHCLNAAEVRRAVPWIAAMPKFILANGIDAAQLAAMPPRGQFRLAHPEFAQKPLALFLSRLHPKKGLDRLIPAWKAVADQNHEARLLIAGGGEPDYVAELHRLVKEQGLADRILFLGQLAGIAKWQALVDADVFVLPSHQEGFSMAITEALAAGTPPVVTEECNFDELAPPGAAGGNGGGRGPAGIIIKGGNMTAFTAAVAELLHDPARRRALAAAGRTLVAERYTWQKIAADLERVYGDIRSGKPMTSSPLS